MLVGVIAKLRNGELVRFRQENGQNGKWLPQWRAGEMAGCGLSAWNAIECMRFDLDSVTWSAVKKIADLIGVSPDTICPPELRGVNAKLERMAFREIEANRLLAADPPPSLQLPAPHEVIDAKDFYSVKLAGLLQDLTARERRVIEMRYGLKEQQAYTLLEIARIFGVTRERVRMIENKALRKLQQKVDDVLSPNEMPPLPRRR